MLIEISRAESAPRGRNALSFLFVQFLVISGPRSFLCYAATLQSPRIVSSQMPSKYFVPHIWNLDANGTIELWYPRFYQCMAASLCPAHTIHTLQLFTLTCIQLGPQNCWVVTAGGLVAYWQTVIVEVLKGKHLSAKTKTVNSKIMTFVWIVNIRNCLWNSVWESCHLFLSSCVIPARQRPRSQTISVLNGSTPGGWVQHSWQWQSSNTIQY